MGSPISESGPFLKCPTSQISLKWHFVFAIYPYRESLHLKRNFDPLKRRGSLMMITTIIIISGDKEVGGHGDPQILDIISHLAISKCTLTCSSNCFRVEQLMTSLAKLFQPSKPICSRNAYRVH